MTSPNKAQDSVVIIGAGSAGLAAARAIRAAGFSVTVLERADRPGESWRHRHPQLRLNTHRLLSGLPGLAMPKSDGAFPGRDTVIRFLEDYARFIEVPIEYNVAVRHVYQSSTGWEIDTDKGKRNADHVVMATGYDRVPHIPDWPGRECFGGEIIHAAHFGESRRYQEKRVLVVGAGNSGTDLLNHLAEVQTTRLWVSVRHGPALFPTRLYGIPVQLLSPILELCPVPFVDRMLKLTERIAFGDLSRWGLSQHQDGGATRLLRDGIAPAIDKGFIDALKTGRVTVIPAVKRLEDNGVRLTDGRLIQPDVVLCATGYRTGLEQILGSVDLLDQQGVPKVHGGEQHPDYPGLWFTGMRPALSGFFRAAGRTGQEIADAMLARTLPHHQQASTLRRAAAKP